VSESRKRLIEVALPLEAISVACKRDKDKKVGTIKNVHKWFAPMPGPAWRALLFASIVPDPDDPVERASLLKLVEALVPSDGNAPHADVLAAAKERLAESGDLPTVLDPFCGGGSTIVEALRLGLPAVGSDLNPVAVLISRTLCQLIPAVMGRPPLNGSDSEFAMRADGLEGLLVDLRHYGEEVGRSVSAEVGSLYPLGADGGMVIAWLWARTFRCPNPACGATIPMYSSPWLSKRNGSERWLRPVRDGRLVTFEVGAGKEDPPPPTKVGVRGARFRCVACGEVASEAHLRSEAQAGRLGVQMLAVVTDSGGVRAYLPASDDQVAAADLALPEVYPSEDLPDQALGFRVQLYGMHTQADLYTHRQLHSLGAFADAVAAVRDQVRRDGGDDTYADTIASLLGLCLGKLAQANSAQVRWNPRAGGSSKAEPAFSRHALPMIWDFAEVNPFAGSVGDWMGQIETVSNALKSLPRDCRSGRVEARDARDAAAQFKPGSVLVATDPPYFAQIGYADLSDYFYVWHRRGLRAVHPDLYSTITTPKAAELIASPYRHGGDSDAARRYFVDGFTDVFASLGRVARPDLPILIVYAHRQEETDDEDGLGSSAWDAMLEALLAGGLGVVGTWPIHATTSARMIGLGTNALASYIVLVCRPRNADAPITDRRGFLQALRAELPEPLRALQEAATLPFDLTQASLGPGMAVFSRFGRVLDSEGASMSVRTAIGLIHQVRSEVLSEFDDEFDAETRWAVQWFEQYGFERGPFGEAEKLFTATATSLEGVRRSGVLASKAPSVWLLRPNALPVDWDPMSDPNVPVWEIAMHLLRSLDEGGEGAAASLLSRVGAKGALARDLAYRIADICERRKWATEAVMVNSLIGSWSEIARLASRAAPVDQTSLL